MTQHGIADGGNPSADEYRKRAEAHWERSQEHLVAARKHRDEEELAEKLREKHAAEAERYYAMYFEEREAAENCQRLADEAPW